MDLDPADFVTRMDCCWIEGRFDDLSAFLADDVVLVAPGGTVRLEGAGPAIESYREFMGRTRLVSYRSGDHQVTRRRGAAVIEYAWSMAWESDGERTDAKGREVLVLSADHGWRVIWRTQLPEAG